jgi:hypothetical protein
MDITIVNIDMTNPASVEHAVEKLRALTVFNASVLRSVESMTIFVPSDVVDTTRLSLPEDTLAIYGKMTRAFLEVLLARIDKCGSTTLEDAAADANISLETARAYLRNAGRTAAAHKVALPVIPEWQPDMGCNTYTATPKALAS